MNYNKKYLLFIRREAEKLKNNIDLNKYNFHFYCKISYRKDIGRYFFFNISYNRINYTNELEYIKIVKENSLMNELINVLCIFEQIKEKHNL